MLGKTCENATDFLQNQGKRIIAYFNFYNMARFHQSLDYNVPDEMYKCFQYYDSAKDFFSTKDFSSLSVEVYKNVRFIFTHKEHDRYIEQYFDKTLLSEKINGKSFTHENNAHDPEHYFGKQVFATNIIKKKQDSIDYSNFRPLFDELSQYL